MDRDLLEDFINESLKRSLAKNYPASVFRRMLKEHGSVEAVRRLAEADVLQSGLVELAKLGLLKWPAEEAVIRFPKLFPRELTRASAKFKLEQARKQASDASQT